MAIERLTYQGWPGACRVTNGTASLVIVPAVARIMHFSLDGEPNIFWSNAWVAGRKPVGTTWSNYGGNKVWIWPQEDWPTRTGREWPPPMDLPGVIEHTLEEVDELTVRLTSPEIPGFGARIRRQIRLDADAPRVEIVSAVERLESPASFAMTAWTVSQLPSDGWVLGRLAPDSRLAEGYRIHGGAPWKVHRITSDVLRFERPEHAPCKLGFDGNLLAWAKDDRLFVERSIDAGRSTSDFAPGDRAQVYGHIDADPDLPPGPSYVELELTAPLRTLRSGESATLTTSLELHRLAPAERTVEAIADRLRRLG